MKIELKYLPVLINLGRGALTKEKIELARKEWGALIEYIEQLEEDNCRMGEMLVNNDNDLNF